jgi:hypothetical protein
MIRSRSRKPRRSASRKPRRSRSRKPRRSESRKPRRSESRKPRRSRSRKPRRSASRKPRRSASRKPRRSASRKPRRSRSRKPRRSASRKPRRSSSRKPRRSSSRKPRRSSSRKPRRSSSRKPLFRVAGGNIRKTIRGVSISIPHGVREPANDSISMRASNYARPYISKELLPYEFQYNPDISQPGNIHVVYAYILYLGYKHWSTVCVPVSKSVPGPGVTPIVLTIYPDATYLVKTLAIAIKRCFESMGNRRFIAFPLHMQTYTKAHVNMFLIDTVPNSEGKCTIERFEPHGGAVDVFEYNSRVTTAINELTMLLKEYGDPREYIYIDQNISCPRIGGQSFQVKEQIRLSEYLAPKIQGYCSAFSMWYLDLRLTNPTLTALEVQSMAISSIENDGQTWTAFIHNYAELMDKFANQFKAAVLDEGRGSVRRGVKSSIIAAGMYDSALEGGRNDNSDHEDWNPPLVGRIQKSGRKKKSARR